MQPATGPIPTSALTAQHAHLLSLIYPVHLELSSNTDISSMADATGIKQWAQVKDNVQSVRDAACNVLLAHVRALAENDPSRPIAVVVLGNVNQQLSQDVEEDQPLEFNWSPERHRVREAARQFLESNADH